MLPINSWNRDLLLNIINIKRQKLKIEQRGRGDRFKLIDKEKIQKDKICLQKNEKSLISGAGMEAMLCTH